MPKSIISLLIFSTLSLICSGQDPLLNNVFQRQTQSLDGYWKYIVDPYENGFYDYRYEAFDDQENPSRGAFFTNSKAIDKSDRIEYDFDKMDSIMVPSDWNTEKEQLYYYEGSVWYKKSFDYRKKNSSNRVFVYFEGANYQADVYFNGQKLGRHIGGFTPFNFEVTSLLLEKDNFLIVKVDNKRKREGVPTLNTDWWNYGGLTRSVHIVETPATFIRDYFIQLDPEYHSKIKGHVILDGADVSEKQVAITFPELGIIEIIKTDANGRAKFTVGTPLNKYWSPDDPIRYKVIIEHDQDKIEDLIGFRSIKTRGQDIMLNGEPIFLKGICIHEESPIHDGRAHSAKDARQLLTWVKELGCNFVRLAHYPHNEHMVRIADEVGILVWEEIPVYWTIDWKNPETYDNALIQLSEVIQRDKNRASVIIWSMANETPTSEARNRFLTDLAKHTRSMDPTRLISAALEQSSMQGDRNMRTIHDSFADVVDILSFNQYIGWYDGLPEKCRDITWKINYDKPVIVSEFGAGAKQGYHETKETRWTEEYQDYLYKETLTMLDNVEQLRGITPWILVDFRSPRRVLPEIQDGWNRKGLISDEGIKKKAFYTLKNYYAEKR